MGKVVRGKATYEYVSGNTVRKRELEKRNTKVYENNIRVVNNEKTKTKKVKVLKTMNVFSFISLVFVLVLVSYLCFNYLNAETSMQKNLKTLENMEKELEVLTNENDVLDSSINSSIDLEEIRDTAINKLGMVYANKNQIIKYDKTESEYVRQHENIPK